MAEEVRAAVDGKAIVGLVTYPFESLIEVAAFKARYASGHSNRNEGEVYLFKSEGADPQADRVKLEHEGGWSVFAAVQDEAEAIHVVTELAGEGATLFELYGGLDMGVADQIIQATHGRIPVGAATYGLINTKIQST